MCFYVKSEAISVLNMVDKYAAAENIKSARAEH